MTPTRGCDGWHSKFPYEAAALKRAFYANRQSASLPAVAGNASCDGLAERDARSCCDPSDWRCANGQHTRHHIDDDHFRTAIGTDEW